MNWTCRAYWRLQTSGLLVLSTWRNMKLVKGRRRCVLSVGEVVDVCENVAFRDDHTR